MNNKAQLFTLDLLLALVPLTIALGMSATAIGGIVTQIQEYAYFYSMQRQAGDAADVLIKTPGVPPDWNATNLPNTPGLAVYSCNRAMPNFLDYDKITALSGTLLSRLFGSNTNVYFEVVNLQTNSTIKTLTYNVTGVPIGSAANVFVVERIVSLGINASTSTALTYNKTNIDKDTINWNLVLPSCPEIKNITILVTTGSLTNEYVEFEMKEPDRPGANHFFFIGINTVNYSWDDATPYATQGLAQSAVKTDGKDSARSPDDKTIDEFLRENLVVGTNAIEIKLDVKKKSGAGAVDERADVAVFLNIAYSIPVPVEGKVTMKIWR
ncbi:MAG: hypothetical protein QME59_01440 [Candidatus Hydrothermarchaeota archaeon]|nr:hypothetical protein [Candidatus Hydrothermarchaeota archaeon]